jgi:acetate kinase
MMCLEPRSSLSGRVVALSAGTANRQTVKMDSHSPKIQVGSSRTEPERASRPYILTINGGSSSLKFALFTAAKRPKRILSGRVERIGMPGSRLIVASVDRGSEDREVQAPDQASAIALLIERLEQSVSLKNVAIVGHRVVHGGSRFYRPILITPEVISELRTIVPYDPDHLPGELQAIEAFRRLDLERPQVACFDTAFHHDLPRVAQIIAIPRRYEAEGVRRYGFHGLSYAYLMQELEQVAGAEAACGRVILAHLGSGASMAAVHEGRCVETSMGFTPTSGLVMSTRCGDLDPGLIRFLMRASGMTIDQFHDLVNHESGLLGVSETSPDLRDLLSRQDNDIRAAEAVALFCYRAKSWLGALAAALGGLDTLVFAGGIGENSPEARRRICEGLEFLGISLDEHRNSAGAPIISAEHARVAVRVIRTDEESMIARATIEFLPRIEATQSPDS